MTTPSNAALIASLNTLRGQHLRIEHRRVVIVEVLAEEGLLVLQETEGRPEVQTDQFGLATRRTPRLWSVPLRSEVDPDAVHPTVQLCLDAGVEATGNDPMRS
ncbi:MAG: hypothetical protein ACFCUG_09965 [Thiotrichales bacterium]